ncbi:iron ABC transporter permease [Moorena sp. SIO3H5]|uniref:ABC transporter permease n=1 Tax=Moorena sp. SIO3H5 TaxID=2607834 RepID=UPI0013B78E10|nr:iron ABC transporter permease [Moorena sp. SIO3H5]NEO72578.1 iron ABC transporter permease [Moorena sp. SIO3H5]
MPLKISALLSGNTPWHRLGLPGWTVSVIAIALLICAPVLFVLGSMFSDSSEVWSHLVSTVLGSYILNSLWLILGVSSGVLILGVSTAWLVTMCRFWGSRVFEWALLLPLAAPAYLLAYTYTNMLDFFGPVQTWLRQLFGWTSVQDYWFPNVRSLWGAIAMLSLVLYPYVYLITRVAFLEQSVRTLEAARSLGCTPWRGFFTVALPLARPAIMAGLALALMETLSDFGTVEYFGVSTFTTGIYRTWLGMGERSAAAQLAACLLLFVIVLILLERWSRKQSRYYETGSSYQRIKPFSLTGGRGILALLACSLPIALGFLAPAAFLLHMTIKNAEETLDDNFWQLATNSLLLAITTAAIAMVLALVMAYGQRLVPKLGMRLAVRTAAMGYAIPGSVIAVGVLMPLGQLDNTIDSWMRASFGLSTGLLFSGTIIALVYAYLVRFLAISFNTVESSLGKIKPSLDDASRSLGYGPTLTLIKVHAPLMWGGLLTAAMLVFVDVMKELPATLIMRPFNFDTLAVRVYQYASDERLIQASAPALAIVLVGIIPVILLSFKIAKSQR